MHPELEPVRVMIPGVGYVTVQRVDAEQHGYKQVDRPAVDDRGRWIPLKPLAALGSEPKVESSVEEISVQKNQKKGAK